MILAGPITILFPLSLLVGLILLVLGLMRLRGGWKAGMPMIAGALFLQSWWVIAVGWFFLTQDYQNYGINAETHK